jgi:hypothetical protein
MSDPTPPPADVPAPDPAAAVPPVVPPTDAPAAPSAAKPRSRLVLPLAIGGGALLLIVGGLAVTYAVLNAAHAPEKPVVAYLDDIVAGHVEDAVAQLENGPRSPLLDDDVYAATDDRITGYTIGEVTESGATATVTVELTTESGNLTEKVPLVSTGSDMLWQLWAVDGEKLPEIDIAWFAPDGYDLAVNGVALPGVSGRQHLPALPGSYEFGPAEQSEVISAEPVTATVDSFSHAGDDSVDTSVILTEEGEKQARSALNAFVNKCIKQHVLSPKGACGFGILSDGQVYPTLNWSITRRPQVTFNAFDGFGFEVITTKTGIFKLTGENSQYIITGIIDDYEYFGSIGVDGEDKVTYTSRFED